jgi:hypothetical protein
MARSNHIKSANTASRETNHKFAVKIGMYAKSHGAPKVDMDMFGEALGYGSLTNTMLASDLQLRRKSTSFLGKALEALWHENPDLDFHFWTLIHERGHSSDREPVVDLKFLRGLADRTFRNYDLSGIYVVEAQGLGNRPAKGEQEGRTIMVHVHAITWSAGGFDMAAAENELNSNDAWQNGMGALPVRIKPIRQEPGELAYMAYYLFKPPYDAKMMGQRKRGERMKSTEKGYRPEFAARLLELLSQLELKELVRASGGGTAIRKQWLRRLTNWHRSRERWVEGRLPPYYFDSLWDRYRGKKKQKAYSRFLIIR